jgi:hypothetical protein
MSSKEDSLEMSELSLSTVTETLADEERPREADPRSERDFGFQDITKEPRTTDLSALLSKTASGLISAVNAKVE